MVEGVCVILKEMLTAEKPLVYRNPLSHLVSALPYIDAEATVHKSQVLHLINAEQALLHTDPQDYIKDLRLPRTPFLDSPEFEEEVRRVKAQAPRGEPKQSLPEINPNLSNEEIEASLRKAEIATSYNFLRLLSLKTGTLTSSSQGSWGLV